MTDIKLDAPYELSQTEHLCFYIDLLGSKEAVMNSNPQQFQKLIHLLGDMAVLQGDFTLQTETLENGKRTMVRPAISTFSDHIVISYRPSTEIFEPYQSSLHFASRLIGSLASEALALGLLIRGGVTINLLHHQSNVVAGQALVEAYELESKVAKYPRIAVSRNLYSRMKLNPFNLIQTDTDGVRHYDYFPSMILHSGASKNEWRQWHEDACLLAERNVGFFEQQQKWNEMSKWVWFLEKLKKARSEMPNQLFE